MIFGAVCAISMSMQQRDGEGKWSAGAEIEIAARTILIAAGTQPNTVLAREDPAHFELDGRYFQACDEDGAPVRPEPAMSKPEDGAGAVGQTCRWPFHQFFR